MTTDLCWTIQVTSNGAQCKSDAKPRSPRAWPCCLRRLSTCPLTPIAQTIPLLPLSTLPCPNLYISNLLFLPLLKLSSLTSLRPFPGLQKTGRIELWGKREKSVVQLLYLKYVWLDPTWFRHQITTCLNSKSELSLSGLARCPRLSPWGCSSKGLTQSCLAVECLQPWGCPLALNSRWLEPSYCFFHSLLWCWPCILYVLISNLSSTRGILQPCCFLCVSPPLFFSLGFVMVTFICQFDCAMRAQIFG